MQVAKRYAKFSIMFIPFLELIPNIGILKPHTLIH